MIKNIKLMNKNILFNTARWGLFAFVVAVLLALPRQARAAGDDDVIRVTYLENGTTNTILFYFDDDPVLSFDANKVYITVKSQQNGEFEFDNVLELGFGRQATTASRTATAVHLSATGMPRIAGVTATDEVSVLDADGRAAAGSVSYSDGNALLITEGISSGVYTIKTKKQSIKYRKK